MEVGRLFETPAGARPWRPGSSLSRVVGAALAGILVLSGCALPVSEEPAADAAEGLPRDLAAAPAPLEPGELSALEDLDELKAGRPRKGTRKKKGSKDADATTVGAGGGTATGSGGGGGGSSSPSPAPTAPRTLASAGDPSGDAGGAAPAYADLRTLTLASSRRTAIVAVDLDGAIPAKLAQGEVMGLGVDFHTDPRDESDYQLFADGSSDGWFAYLQTPSGFVDYPGAFRIGKRRIVFEVPWSELGRLREGHVSAFVDWSRKRQVVNDFGEDLAPDGGPRAFER